MTLAQIENFIIVAEAGSFSAAAERLYISPQALIQQIAKMEAELGFKLFTRNSKGVLLSPGGKEYYTGTKAILSQYRACTERAARKAGQSSTLRVGLPDNINSAFLLSVCSLFSKRHPQIQLSFENHSVQDTVKALQHGKIDVCAQIRPPEDTPYFCEKLFPVPHYCLVSRSSPLSGKTHVIPEDLGGHTAGVWGAASVYRSFSSYITDHKLDIKLRSLPENFGEALTFCVQGNVLITCAPVISTLKGTLEVIPILFDFGLYYYLACADPANTATQYFLDAAKEASASEAHPWKQTLSGLLP